MTEDEPPYDRIDGLARLICHDLWDVFVGHPIVANSAALLAAGDEFASYLRAHDIEPDFHWAEPCSWRVFASVQDMESGRVRGRAAARARIRAIETTAWGDSHAERSATTLAVIERIVERLDKSFQADPEPTYEGPPGPPEGNGRDDPWPDDDAGLGLTDE